MATGASSTLRKGVGVSEPCVEGDEDFAHDGGDGEEGLFAVCDEASVEGGELALACGGAQRRHVEDGWDLGPSAADFAVALGLAAFVGVRCECGERSEERRVG